MNEETLRRLGEIESQLSLLSHRMQRDSAIVEALCEEIENITSEYEGQEIL